MRALAQLSLLAAFVVGLACAPAQATPARAPAPSQPAAPAASAPGSAPAPPAPAQPAWQAEWERVLAAARQEGKVVVNGPPGDLIRRAMVDGFQKAYPGITLEWSGGTTPEQATKLEAERRAGVHSLDVLVGGTNVLLVQVKPTGALAPLKPALILPEVTDTANWLDEKLDFADSEGELDLVFAVNAQGVAAHNPSLVRADEIDELPKLLDPKWKGKLVISDPVVGGSGQALFRWLWLALGPEKAAEYIAALRAQAGAVDRDRRRMVEWVARGRYSVLVNPDNSVLQQMMMEGLPVEPLPYFKDYGTYVSPAFGSIGLIDRAPNPNAAKVFVNWILSREGQTALSKAANITSRRLDVPRDHLPPGQAPQPGVRYTYNYYEAQTQVPPELDALFKEVFGR
jgi:iron(III) transport system substrate-binding protein